MDDDAGEPSGDDGHPSTEPSPEPATGQPADPLRDFADHSPDMVAALDTSGRILAVNRAARRILGWTEAELVGLPLIDLTHPDEEALLRDELSRVLGGSNVNDGVARCRTAAGRYRWISWAATYDEAGDRVFIVGRDVTERIEGYLALAHHEAELELELTVEQDNVDRLREADKRKSTYLSAVAHELRVPLTVLAAAGDTLQRLRGRLDEDVRARIEDTVVVHARRMGNLLDELLDVDRLNRDAMSARRVPTDVSQLVRDAIRDSPVADRCRCDTPDQLVADVDPVQVRRIVANLLGNVAKYAPVGLVFVRVSADDTTVRIEVRDEGPGIPHHALRRAFEPFWRLDSRDPRPGTGVGLALVAEFARMHGGSARALPVPTGTHIVVELARHPEADTAAEPAP